MKDIVGTATAAAAAALAFAFAPAPLSAAQSLEEGFANPPDSAKPHTWYHMMNGNVTKEDDLLPSGLIGPVILRFGEPANYH